jgi:hypothetical protein
MRHHSSREPQSSWGELQRLRYCRIVSPGARTFRVLAVGHNLHRKRCDAQRVHHSVGDLCALFPLDFPRRAAHRTIARQQINNLDALHGHGGSGRRDLKSRGLVWAPCSLSQRKNDRLVCVDDRPRRFRRDAQTQLERGSSGPGQRGCRVDLSTHRALSLVSSKQHVRREEDRSASESCLRCLTAGSRVATR